MRELAPVSIHCPRLSPASFTKCAAAAGFVITKKTAKAMHKKNISLFSDIEPQ